MSNFSKRNIFISLAVCASLVSAKDFIPTSDHCTGKKRVINNESMFAFNDNYPDHCFRVNTDCFAALVANHAANQANLDCINGFGESLLNNLVPGACDDAEVYLFAVARTAYRLGKRIPSFIMNEDKCKQELLENHPDRISSLSKDDFMGLDVGVSFFSQHISDFEPADLLQLLRDNRFDIFDADKKIRHGQFNYWKIKEDAWTDIPFVTAFVEKFPLDEYAYFDFSQTFFETLLNEPTLSGHFKDKINAEFLKILEKNAKKVALQYFLNEHTFTLEELKEKITDLSFDVDFFESGKIKSIKFAPEVFQDDDFMDHLLTYNLSQLGNLDALFFDTLEQDPVRFTAILHQLIPDNLDGNAEKMALRYLMNEAIKAYNDLTISSTSTVLEKRAKKKLKVKMIEAKIAFESSPDLEQELVDAKSDLLTKAELLQQLTDEFVNFPLSSPPTVDEELERTKLERQMILVQIETGDTSNQARLEEIEIMLAPAELSSEEKLAEVQTLFDNFILGDNPDAAQIRKQLELQKALIEAKIVVESTEELQSELEAVVSSLARHDAQIAVESFSFADSNNPTESEMIKFNKLNKAYLELKTDKTDEEIETLAVLSAEVNLPLLKSAFDDFVVTDTSSFGDKLSKLDLEKKYLEAMNLVSPDETHVARLEEIKKEVAALKVSNQNILNVEKAKAAFEAREINEDSLTVEKKAKLELQKAWIEAQIAVESTEELKQELQKVADDLVAINELLVDESAKALEKAQTEYDACVNEEDCDQVKKLQLEKALLEAKIAIEQSPANLKRFAEIESELKGIEDLKTKEKNVKEAKKAVEAFKLGEDASESDKKKKLELEKTLILAQQALKPEEKHIDQLIEIAQKLNSLSSGTSDKDSNDDSKNDLSQQLEKLKEDLKKDPTNADIAAEIKSLTIKIKQEELNSTEGAEEIKKVEKEISDLLLEGFNPSASDLEALAKSDLTEENGLRLDAFIKITLISVMEKMEACKKSKKCDDAIAAKTLLAQAYLATAGTDVEKIKALPGFTWKFIFDCQKTAFDSIKFTSVEQFTSLKYAKEANIKSLSETVPSWMFTENSSCAYFLDDLFTKDKRSYKVSKYNSMFGDDSKLMKEVAKWCDKNSSSTLSASFILLVLAAFLFQ